LSTERSPHGQGNRGSYEDRVDKRTNLPHYFVDDLKLKTVLTQYTVWQCAIPRIPLRLFLLAIVPRGKFVAPRMDKLLPRDEKHVVPQIVSKELLPKEEMSQQDIEPTRQNVHPT
jgi:hypothetical protein